jgi:hypothetical protein
MFFYFIDISCTRLNAVTRDKYSFNNFDGDGVQYKNYINQGFINDNHYGPE